VSDYLDLTDEDDGKLFVVRVLNTGERRIARYHHHTLNGRRLKFPCFADPENPEDYRRWVHDGNARAVSRVRREPPEE
jgi:hypothetical protein